MTWERTFVPFAASGKIGSFLPFSALEHIRRSSETATSLTALCGLSSRDQHAAARLVIAAFRCGREFSRRVYQFSLPRDQAMH